MIDQLDFLTKQTSYQDKKTNRIPAGFPRTPFPALEPAYAITELHYQTGEGPQFIDITTAVTDFVAQNQIEVGTALVYSRHTTAAVKINENEPLLLEDLRDRLTTLFNPNEYYRHNDFDIRTHNMTPDEHPNGHSHCQHLLLSTSETIPIINGKLALGRWQSIFLIELDSCRPRQVIVMLNGYKRS